MNKVIVFSNIKGGVGKTTLCAMMASYLHDNAIKVGILDADIQASLARHRERELNAEPEHPVPYEVIRLDTSNESSVKNIMDRLKNLDGVVLIDCPGNLNAANLEYIYREADAAVIPISYDNDTIDATGIFVKVLRKINSTAPLFFVPNRINTSEGKAEELRQRAQTTEILNVVGVVTPRIKQSVVVKRYSTLLPLDKYQTAAVEHAFDTVIKKLGINIK